VRRWLDWAFRSRETGRIVVGQRPNALLGLFLVTWALSWWLSPDGTAGRVALAASRVALGLWAADELLRGVNPWRRALGLGVLGYLAWLLLGR
jgi:hypothetical protein